MNDQSRFFTDIPAQFSPEEITPVYTSPSGFTQLYRCTRAGAFRCLKALKEEYREEPLYESLLRKEFEFCYGLDHPNICRITGFGNDPEIGNFIEMQWIDGCTLEQLLHKGDLPHSLADKIAIELCDAVEYIHNREIVHRDLKPSNILITHNGHNVKLIDFGLADSDYHSDLKQAAGTPAYASPELLAGEKVDLRTDIWSIGVILSEMGSRYSGIARKCTARIADERYSNAGMIRDAILRRGSSGRRTMRILFIAAASVVLLAAALTIFLQNGDRTQRAKDSIFERISTSIIQAQ